VVDNICTKRAVLWLINIVSYYYFEPK